MKFKVEETITLRDYVEFHSIYTLQTKVAGGVLRGSWFLLTGLQRFGGGALIVLGVIALIGGLIEGLFNAFGVICLMCGAYLIRKSMKSPKDLEVETILKYDTGEVPDTFMRFFFDEDGFDVFEVSGNSSYR